MSYCQTCAGCRAKKERKAVCAVFTGRKKRAIVEKPARGRYRVSGGLLQIFTRHLMHPQHRASAEMQGHGAFRPRNYLTTIMVTTVCCASCIYRLFTLTESRKTNVSTATLIRCSLRLDNATRTLAFHRDSMCSLSQPRFPVVYQRALTTRFSVKLCGESGTRVMT